MSLRNIDSYQSLQKEQASSPKSFLLFTKSGSGQSNCILANLKPVLEKMSEVPFLSVDLAYVRDVHPHFPVNSVPVILEFEGARMVNLIKGCQSTDFLNSLILKNFYRHEIDTGKKAQTRVTVYSTPTCSWCNTLKRYLDEHHVVYTDIDVSRDQKKAEEMISMSGQQGVPQTNINGKMIVGFNKEEINRLIGIKI